MLDRLKEKKEEIVEEIKGYMEEIDKLKAKESVIDELIAEEELLDDDCEAVEGEKDPACESTSSSVRITYAE